MFDLAKNNIAEKSEAGFEFEVRMPETNDKTGFFITVRGKDSKTVKAYQRKKFQEYQLKDAQAKRRGKEVEQMTLEDAEDLAVESAVLRVMDWRGLQENGVEVVYSKEAAERIFKEHSWIREAVVEESDKLVNFL